MEDLAEVVTALRGVLASVQGPTVGVGVGELRAGVRGLQEVISAASAAQTVRIAQYAARDEQRTEEGVFVPVDRGVGHVNEFADDDQAPVLGDGAVDGDHACIPTGGDLDGPVRPDLPGTPRRSPQAHVA